MGLNTYELAISYNCGGQFAQNVLHYQFDDATFATSQLAAADLITKWDTANRSTLRGILSASVTIVGYKAGRISTPGGFEAHFAVSGSNAGTRAAGISASGLSPVIVGVPVNLLGPRGRVFLPGVSENDIEDGIFTDNYRAAVNSALNTLFDDLTMTGGGAATYGYFRRKPTKLFVALVDFLLSENLGTQRRRMRPT